MNQSKRIVLCVLAGLTAIALSGCGELPSLEGRVHSAALQDTASTRIGRAVSHLVGEHPGKSGVVALTDGRDAFAARVLLARAADRSIDIQYYIWHGDMSGTLLFEELHRAADRGVRVRLLLDDNNTVGLDETIAMLDAHPHIEIRLFNPFVYRGWRALGYLTDFARLNRRMHNKSFTVDSQVTIIGGRNVGDEYFDAGQDMLFVDLDVMAIGAVVADVSQDFDRYWESKSSYPADRILPQVPSETIAELTSEASLIERDSAAAAYMQAITDSPFVRELLDVRLPFEWATTRMVSDDPSKSLGQADHDELLPYWMKQAMGTPTQELQLISPYFVPTAAGVEALVGLAKRGVNIKVLTNSLEATDVAAVHAGYAKRRKPLLEAGVALYEMKRTTPGSAVRDRGLPGSSASSLHAKTFGVDGERLFIGSFNFDPRSARLNTENGFVIESPAMAQEIDDVFTKRVPLRAYEMRLDPSGELQWTELENGEQTIYETEPGTSFLQRATVAVLSVLPIEGLL